MAPPTHKAKINREQWLNDAVSLMRNRLFADHGFTVPAKVRISVGFPKGARGGGSGAIGQCWTPESSGDSHGEIFIHPAIADPVRVLDITAHELVHSINHAAGQTGHGKVFADIAKVIGLEGKMTATVAGSGLLLVLNDYSKMLGPFPHQALTPGGGPKKQGTRLLKVLCPRCGYAVRVTAKWVDVGLPTCPCGEDMVQDGEEGGGE